MGCSCCKDDTKLNKYTNNQNIVQYECNQCKMQYNTSSIEYHEHCCKHQIFYIPGKQMHCCDCGIIYIEKHCCYCKTAYSFTDKHSQDECKKRMYKIICYSCENNNGECTCEQINLC